MSFKEKGFIEGSTSADILLTVDVQAKKMLLRTSPGTSFIDARTAERQARAFPKSGITLRNGTRIGQGFELVIENDVAPPEKLRHSPREVYVGGRRDEH
ncbi:MAG: hypothetical protein WED05_11940 [Candidatus Atabeyarchaeum deiterrae]